MGKKHGKPRLSETLSALADEFVARLDRLHKSGDINANASECLGGLSEWMASLLREMKHRETLVPYQVVISVRQSGESRQHQIGTVSPPTVNGKPAYTQDEEFRGQQSPAGKPINVHDALADLWAEWREVVEQPETESEFVKWLVQEKGWRHAETDVLQHVIET
jgi:hypothetical protein